MVNTYYTPNIEEWHIGFEYEFKRVDDTEYTKAAIKDSLQINDILNSIYSLRVKHLDADDVKDLYNTYKISNSKFKTFLSEKFENDNVTILQVVNQNSSQLLFYGTIKNKNELQKLMQQLQIL